MIPVFENQSTHTHTRENGKAQNWVLFAKKAFVARKLWLRKTCVEKSFPNFKENHAFSDDEIRMNLYDC